MGFELIKQSASLTARAELHVPSRISRRSRHESLTALSSSSRTRLSHCDQVPAPTSSCHVVRYVGSEIWVPVKTKGWNTYPA